MILIIDCNLKEIKFHVFKENRKEVSISSFTKDIEDVRDNGFLKKYIYAITGKNRLNAIAFRVLFGGDYFDGPVLVDSRFFGRFEKLTDFFPFYVPLILNMLKRFRNLFKNIPIIAFFETSFFLKLPNEEKHYALPFEYYKSNKIKKWGFHGIFHEANARIVPSKDKNVSIVFDKQTSVCAIYNKKPFSISLGHTPLEGIMSRTTCGDMDPGIIFYFMNIHKFSLYEVDEMLKKKSGFIGLTGYNITLKDMLKLRGKDRKVDLAFSVYLAQIMKYIGEGIAILGGLDNIIFTGDSVDVFTPIIYDIIKKMSFLGINPACLPWDKDKEIVNITSSESKIKAYINRVNCAKIIFYALKEGGPLNY